MPTAVQRLLPHPAPAPRRGRGGPRTAGDRGRHADAGRHRARPALVRLACEWPRAGGLRAASLGPRRSRRGSRPPRRRRPERVLVSVFLDGRRRLALDARPDERDPQYAANRPTLALPNGQGIPLTEDASLRWHPSLRRLAELHGEGKVTVMPAIGYDDANQSHFTSRHYWEVGATNPRPLTGWLGRYPRPARRRRQPAPGPLARLGPPARRSPPATCRSPRSAEPDNYDFWTPGVWGEVQDRMLDAFGDLGALPTTRRRPRPGARRGGGQPAACATQLAPYQDGFTESRRRAYPGGRASRPARGRSRRCSRPACRCGSWRSSSGGYDTHDDQAGSLPADLS